MARTDWRRSQTVCETWRRRRKQTGFRLSTIVSARKILLRYSRVLSSSSGAPSRMPAGKSSPLTSRSALSPRCQARRSDPICTTLRSCIGSCPQDTRRPPIRPVRSLRTVGVPQRTRSVQMEAFTLETLRWILEPRNRSCSQGGGTVFACRKTTSSSPLFSIWGAILWPPTREVGFRAMAISTVVKLGKHIPIPIHPSLADLLRELLAVSGYRSGYLFDEQAATSANGWSDSRQDNRLKNGGLRTSSEKRTPRFCENLNLNFDC